MTFVFRNETHDVKLRDVSIGIGLVNACSTWMCCERGEGEEEIENHGRSRVKVSSQGTDLNGQWSLRMRAHKANLKKVQDVRTELLLNSPFLFFDAASINRDLLRCLRLDVALLRLRLVASDLFDFLKPWSLENFLALLLPAAQESPGEGTYD